MWRTFWENNLLVKKILFRTLLGKQTVWKPLGKTYCVQDFWENKFRRKLIVEIRTFYIVFRTLRCMCCCCVDPRHSSCSCSCSCSDGFFFFWGGGGCFLFLFCCSFPLHSRSTTDRRERRWEQREREGGKEGKRERGREREREGERERERCEQIRRKVDAGTET